MQTLCDNMQPSSFPWCYTNVLTQQSDKSDRIAMKVFDNFYTNLGQVK